MSSHSKAESGDGKTPEITVWDGNAPDGYLDAVDAYARYTRKSYRGGIASLGTAGTSKQELPAPHISQSFC